MYIFLHEIKAKIRCAIKYIKHNEPICENITQTKCPLKWYHKNVKTIVPKIDINAAFWKNRETMSSLYIDR